MNLIHNLVVFALFAVGTFAAAPAARLVVGLLRLRLLRHRLRRLLRRRLRVVLRRLSRRWAEAHPTGCKTRPTLFHRPPGDCRAGGLLRLLLYLR